MQHIFILQLLGRRVSLHASLQSAIEHAPALIVDTWREVSPGRWSPAVTRYNRFSGYEIVREELHGAPDPAPATELRRPRFEVQDGAVIGIVGGDDIPLGYTVGILTVRGALKFRAAEAQWKSPLFPSAEGAILAAQQRERGLRALARVVAEAA